jgi:hypothetical protein
MLSFSTWFSSFMSISLWHHRPIAGADLVEFVRARDHVVQGIAFDRLPPGEP